MKNLIEDLEKEKEKTILYEETLKTIRSQLFDVNNEETILTKVIDNVLGDNIFCNCNEPCKHRLSYSKTLYCSECEKDIKE